MGNLPLVEDEGKMVCSPRGLLYTYSIVCNRHHNCCHTSSHLAAGGIVTVSGTKCLLFQGLRRPLVAASSE